MTDFKSGNNSLRIIPVTSAIVIAMLYAPAHVAADSLSFNSTPVSEAVSRIDKTFDVTLELGRGIDLRRNVTFTVDNLKGPGALLDAVNSLANAVNADYRKVFVISKVAGDAKPSDPVIDASDAPVVFNIRTMPAAKAIAVVAGVDSATAQMPPSLDTPVTFSGLSLTAEEAARQIARQTHTEWKIEYALTPHTAQGTLPGKIIGYTGAGRPIVEMPDLTFRKPKADAVSAGNSPASQNLNTTYWSAVMRGDRSAMLKFQRHDAPPSANPPSPSPVGN